MKHLLTHLSVLIVLIGTVTAGLMRGQMVNRWGIQEAQQAAETRLRQPLPDRVGNWKRQVGIDEKLPEDTAKMLECNSYIRRSYENIQTGDVVSMFVLVGPVGPIAVHTPEICYSSRHWTLDGKRQKTEIVDIKGNRHSLWEVELRSNGLDGQVKRVYYGWSTGGSWNATSGSRYAYAGAPYLYKLQLAGPNRSAIDGFSPTLDFLSQFLAQCQDRLIDVSSSPSQESGTK